ncbi:MAG: prepilin-type N-terminal cleavage/methylation domain-containing protein [Candidatus Sumerlaeaceae bacterium]
MVYRYPKLRLRSGFTLIELLIVVAIIAILAAIAVPNFLEAQTRSKVSRVKADERSFATAMEAYTVDHNKCSPTFNNNSIVLPWGDTGDAASPDKRINRWHWLTTPIAYLTSPYQDAFAQPNVEPNLRFLIIQSPPGLAEVTNPAEAPYSGSIGKPSVLWRESAQAKIGDPFWVIYSAGPDKDLDRLDPEYTSTLPGFGIQEYDSTNGTVSDGDIIRFRQ